jgi:hypothetical protein
LTRAYRRRREQPGSARRPREELQWDEDYSYGTYKDPGVEWGDDDSGDNYSKSAYAQRESDVGWQDTYDEYEEPGYYGESAREYERPSRRRSEAPGRYDRYDTYYDEEYSDESVVFDAYDDGDAEFLPYDREEDEDFYRRGAEDKRAYLTYSEQYHQRSQQDYLAPGAILPGERFMKKTPTMPKEELYMEYAPKDWREKREVKGTVPTIYRILNIFYEPFILRNFGMKLPAMQLIGMLALIELFNISFSIGNSTRQLMISTGQFHGWFEWFSPMVTSILGAVLGLMLSLYPSVREEPRRIIKLSLVVITFVVLLFLPLMNLIFVSGWGGFFNSFMEMLIILGEVMLLLVYASPVILGVLAIWGRKGGEGLIILTTVLMLLVVIISNGYDIWKNGSLEKGSASMFFLYAIILFIYMECSDSSVKYYRFAQEIPDDPENRDQIYFFNKTLSQYFVYLVVLIVIALILGLVVFYRTTFLGAMGSQRLAESLEATTYFGLVISMVVMFTILGTIVVVIRNWRFFLSPAKKIFDSISQQRMKKKEMLRVENEVRRLKALNEQL